MDMQDVLRLKKDDADKIRQNLFKIFKEVSNVLSGISKFIDKMHLKTDKQRRSFYAGFILGRFIERNEIAAAILNQINREEDKEINKAG